MAITGSPLDGPADCTLACDEGHLTAHKILLCAHSQYLLDILSNFPEAEHPIIILTEINIIDIRILVNYMYTGELTITNDCSPSNILRAAKILRIESLTDFEDEDDSMMDDSIEPSQTHADSNNSHHNININHNSNNVNNNNNNSIITDNKNNINLSNSINSHSDIMSDNNHSSSKTNKSNKRNQHHHHHQQQQHTNINNNNNTTHSNNNNNNNNNSSSFKNFDASPASAVAAAAAAVATASKHQRDGPNNKIRCHLCNIGLSDVKCLYRHVLTRHLSEKWGYKCEFCDREFSRDDHLMRHYTTKHKNMEFNREKIRETRRLNREMAKNYHDQISKFEGSL